MALKQNNAHAQWCVGLNYKGGYSGYPQDWGKALHYFTLSANNGSSKGQLDLALMYVNGTGVAQDYEKAVYWLEKSAAQGNIEAKGRLGIALVSGLGCVISADNKRRGKELILEAAEKGDEAALSVIDDIKQIEVKERNQLAKEKKGCKITTMAKREAVERKREHIASDKRWAGNKKRAMVITLIAAVLGAIVLLFMVFSEADVDL